MARRPAADRPSERRRTGVRPPMPWPVVASVGLSVVAVAVLLMLAFLLYALGGLSGDGVREPWVWVVMLCPLVQLFGTMWLVTRRGWVPMVVAVVPAALFAGLLYANAGEGGVGAWPLMIVGFPLAAAVLAASPPSRRWLAASSARTA
ncbi:hypothetical protein [Blastococcus sp. SYSU D00820]